MANRVGSVAYARIRADILALARSIPPGRMTTYGALAGWIDISARQAAYLLATLTPKELESVPWHRVVQEGGVVSRTRPVRFAEQVERLAEEGVVVDGAGQVQAWDVVSVSLEALASGVPRQVRPPPGGPARP